jgi:hypothetical protein
VQCKSRQSRARDLPLWNLQWLSSTSWISMKNHRTWRSIYRTRYQTKQLPSTLRYYQYYQQ